MITSAISTADPETIFDWNAPRSRRRSLLSFLGASILLHALCFYIFQIIYPPAAPPLPPPARVNIITPATEEGRVLLRWIEAEDPALSSTTQRAPNDKLLAPPKPAYVPSYVNRQPALKIPPPFEPDLSVPSAQPPGPVPTARTTSPATPPSVKTAITFANQSELGAPQLPPLQFHSAAAQLPQAAEFRVAINSLGEVRYCFLENSSGDSALDEQARQTLLLTRFPAFRLPSSAPRTELVWSVANVEWGNDLAPTSSPSPSQTPAP